MRRVQSKESQKFVFRSNNKARKGALGQCLIFKLEKKRSRDFSGKTTWVFPGKTDRRIDGEPPGACQALATDELPGTQLRGREARAQSEQPGFLLFQGQKMK